MLLEITESLEERHGCSWWWCGSSLFWFKTVTRLAKTKPNQNKCLTFRWCFTYFIHGGQGLYYLAPQMGGGEWGLQRKEFHSKPLFILPCALVLTLEWSVPLSGGLPIIKSSPPDRKLEGDVLGLWGGLGVNLNAIRCLHVWTSQRLIETSFFVCFFLHSEKQTSQQQRCVTSGSTGARKIPDFALTFHAIGV